MAPVRIASVTSSGLPIEYEDGAVRVGSDTSSLKAVIDYDRIGALTWVSEDTRSWVYEHANAGAATGTASHVEQTDIVLTAETVPAASQNAQDIAHAAGAKVSATARAVADGAITEPRRHSMPLWAKVGWILSMIGYGALLALVGYLAVRAATSVDYEAAARTFLEANFVSQSRIMGILSAIGGFLLLVWNFLTGSGFFFLAMVVSFVFSVAILLPPSYGMAHRAARGNSNKYWRATIITVLMPVFALVAAGSLHIPRSECGPRRLLGALMAAVR